MQLGRGRKFPSLLFVTCRPLLERNVGVKEATFALNLVQGSADVELLELPETPDENITSKRVLEKLRAGNYEGVVIIGGYDVVPAKRLEVLDPALRENIIRVRGSILDQDNFIVWSDDVYVDLDGDSLPELPVSRIPDARRSDVLLAALTAPAFKPGSSFAIRNIARPFAEEVFKKLPRGPGPMNISATFAPAHAGSEAALGAVYYMLHGKEEDSTFFWGENGDEDEHAELFNAISVRNIPANTSGSIVFAGCCWGALTVIPRASQMNNGRTIIPKSPEESIAITYLQRGAQAFVGCTGTHYSPGQEPYNYYGKPFHDLFWDHVTLNRSPAEALWEAKKAYARGLPHGQMDVFSRGIELKILRQFTCLGIGW